MKSVHGLFRFEYFPNEGDELCTESVHKLFRRCVMTKLHRLRPPGRSFLDGSARTLLGEGEGSFVKIYTVYRNRYRLLKRQRGGDMEFSDLVIDGAAADSQTLGCQFLVPGTLVKNVL